MATSLPYQEPSITEILTLSSFLIALNIVNAVLDRTLYCGLVGQVLLGIAWGTPGAKWLSFSTSALDLEPAVVQLGYLGLILIAFEGGLSTSIQSVKANLLLSVCVALTGIAAPIALSFALLAPMLGGGGTEGTPTQAFAAGAALCSTSLGTTFTVLSASGLVSTRLGCVLTTAAMLDDVVGLVMVQVVASLGDSSPSSPSSSSSSGAGGSSFSAANTVLRPVLVSVAFAVVPFLACRYAVRPVAAYLARLRLRVSKTETWMRRMLSSPLLPSRQGGAFVVHTALLLALVAGASFAGASALLAAYVAGVVIAWWDAQREEEELAVVEPINTNDPVVSGDNGINVDVVPVAAREGADEAMAITTPTATGIANTTTTANDAETTVDRDSEQEQEQEQEPRAERDHCAPGTDSAASPRQAGCEEQAARTTGIVVYEHYYSQVANHILKPLFFASIGFSIPISQMFEGSILWRGIIYAVLMMIGKLFCGIWLMRLPISPGVGTAAGKKGAVLSFILSRYHALLPMIPGGGGAAGTQQQQQQGSGSENNNTDSGRRQQNTKDGDVSVPSGSPVQARQTQPSPPSPPPQTPPAKPLSLYPAGIISFAMVARGEIGFLISAVAESNGVFQNTSEKEGRFDSGSGSGPASELFLIVTWAIVLCTIIGPVCVGLLVRRIKRLENISSSASSGAGGSSTRTRRDVLGVWGVS